MQTAGATATTYTLGVTAAPRRFTSARPVIRQRHDYHRDYEQRHGLAGHARLQRATGQLLGGSLSAERAATAAALAQGNSGTATQTFQSATAGSFSLMPLVTSATNTNAGGNATLSGSSGATLNVYNLAAATVSLVRQPGQHPRGRLLARRP